MRMPTLRSFGESRTCWEAIDARPHAIRRGSGTGRRKGGSQLQGRPVEEEGRGLNIALAVVTAGVGRGNRSVDAG